MKLALTQHPRLKTERQLTLAALMLAVVSGVAYGPRDLYGHGGVIKA